MPMCVGICKQVRFLCVHHKNFSHFFPLNGERLRFWLIASQVQSIVYTFSTSLCVMHFPAQKLHRHNSTHCMSDVGSFSGYESIDVTPSIVQVPSLEFCPTPVCLGLFLIHHEFLCVIKRRDEGVGKQTSSDVKFSQFPNNLRNVTYFLLLDIRRIKSYVKWFFKHLKFFFIDMYITCNSVKINNK
jgi:hypothetical protein